MSEPLDSTPDSTETTAREPNDRRRFLTKGAVAAAAAAAGVVALSGKAEAADGGALLIGGANSGTAAASNTRLTGSKLTVSTGDGAYAVRGLHLTSGSGVWGQAGSGSDVGTGVRGTVSIGGGVGVLGENSGSSGGIGVKGTSTDGVAIYAEAGTSSLRGTGISIKSLLGPALLLQESGLSIPPSGSWSAGSFVVDGGHVWYCYLSGSGTAAKWVKLSGAPIILGTGYRAYDSRPGEVPLGVTKNPITDGQTRSNIDLKVNGGASAIPSGISAAIVNITATGTSSAGFFGLFKNGIAWPGTSTVNWSAANSNIANSTIVAVDTLSRVAVRGAGSAQCIIDVIGYLP